MPAARSTVIANGVAAVALVGVLVALALIVGEAATGAASGRPTASPDPGQVRTCTDADLTLAVDDIADDPAGEQRQLALVWRNGSTTPCLLDGFPIVDLVGPPTPRFGTARFGSIVNVPRDDSEPRATTLDPGESARSILRWTPPGARPPGPDARVWTPDRIVVATPGERRNQSVAWTYGAMLVGGVDQRGVSFGPITGE